MTAAFVVRPLAVYRATGSLALKPRGGWRYSKFDPHRAFLVQRMVEKSDTAMQQPAVKLLTRAPRSLSRWYIRNGYSVKNVAASAAIG